MSNINTAIAVTMTALFFHIGVLSTTVIGGLDVSNGDAGVVTVWSGLVAGCAGVVTRGAGVVTRGAGVLSVDSGALPVELGVETGGSGSLMIGDVLSLSVDSSIAA